MKILISLAFVIFLGPLLLQAQVKRGDFTVAEAVEVDGKKLILNGTDFRKAGFLGTKVYLGALYLVAKEKSADLILSSDSVKLIDVWPTYDISAEDSRKGWDYSIQENCAPHCEQLKADIAAFLEAVGEFKSKDHHRYIFSDKGLSFTNNGKEVFKTADVKFAKMLLATWLGSNPPTEKLKNAMLGL